jgi:hypothetical protein
MMAHLNEVKYAALEPLRAGKPATLNELEHRWLTLGGVPEGGTLNERYYKLFGKEVAWNEAAHSWLTAQGVPEGGTLNERWYIYWTGVTRGDGVVGQNGTNFGVGTDFGAATDPAQVDGLDIRWLGSFGEFFWNLRLGPTGQSQNGSFDIVEVSLNGATPVTLNWSGVNLRYQGNSAGGESLWTILGAELGTNKRWSLNFGNSVGLIVNGSKLTMLAGSGVGMRRGYDLGVYGDIEPDTTRKGDPISGIIVNNSNGRVRFRVMSEYPQDAFTTFAIEGNGTLNSADATYNFNGTETEWQWLGTGFTLNDGDVYEVLFT